MASSAAFTSSLAGAPFSFLSPAGASAGAADAAAPPSSWQSPASISIMSLLLSGFICPPRRNAQQAAQGHVTVRQTTPPVTTCQLRGWEGWGARAVMHLDDFEPARLLREALGQGPVVNRHLRDVVGIILGRPSALLLEGRLGPLVLGGAGGTRSI